MRTIEMKKGMKTISKKPHERVLTAIRRCKGGYWLFEVTNKYGLVDTVTINENVFHLYDWEVK